MVLVGLEMWNQEDQIHVSSNPDTTLDNFLRWRTQNLVGRHQHDNAQLITYVGGGRRAGTWEACVGTRGTREGGRFRGVRIRALLLFAAGLSSPGPPWDWPRCRPCAPRTLGL